MLIDPDLWTAFNDAKERLLTAIKISLPFGTHFPSLSPSDRDSSRRLRDETIGTLDIVTTRLQEAMNDLDGSCKDLHICRSLVETSISLISHLPHELIRHIVKFAVGDPENTQTILNLSHVSVAWRNAATDISELFTSCNWDKWHFELISIWLNRARQQPQSISLRYPTHEELHITQDDPLRIRHVPRPFDYEDYEGQLWEKLQQALLNCVTLRIWGGEIPMADFDSWLSSRAMPRLRSLTVEVYSHEPGTITIPENAPALQNLVLELCFPAFKGSYLITNMRCKVIPNPQWSEWVEMLNSLPHLERLSLGWNWRTNLLDGMPSIHLPMLHELELRELSRLEVIKSFIVPNIKTLVLTSPELQAEESDQLWNNMVSYPLSTMVNCLRLV